MGSSKQVNESREIESTAERSLTSGMNQRQIAAVRTSEANSRIVHNGQIECELGKISSAYNEREFCERIIGSAAIATAYCKDIDELAEQKKAASVITNDRHSKVTPEELARKWNVGLQTAKDMLQVTTQCGIRTAVHPMTRRVRVDHLNLHRTRSVSYTHLTLPTIYSV